MRRPQAMQLPAMALQNRRAKYIPLDWIGGLRESRAVAEHADGHIIGSLWMLQRQIDTKAIIAPEHIRAGFLRIEKITPETLGKSRMDNASDEDSTSAL